ncbi:protein containing prepilin-type N- cleavage/methylation domain protein [Sulfurimonas aquatica]|uniref:Protein containing prepilin-type N-cleavage/methylation domain protein n=1 Tax=Sulfurimonas aquatica TaxID=2672570 RepID=A0A975AYN6_9BACT|nr:type II secretion system protein [Sulfurimonas aquatica]QSZ41026.1 protein containing prepilin-type N- cleavage/methylation domain protein [Sulfurimonas aquatica]
MKYRSAFTMLELIFVIVIMGIIGKFGTEFLAQASKSFIFSNINNQLQSDSASTVEFISARLRDRIKDSVIARTGAGAPPIALFNAVGNTYSVLEWISSDIDGFRGNSDNVATDNFPNWSGVIDLVPGNAAGLVSPGTDTAKVSSLINTLSYGDKTIADAALYFIGSNSNINGYGWSGAITDQNQTLHPIDFGANSDEFSPGITFAGVDIYEYYKLVWTAYALVYTAGTNGKGTLTLYYDYQPWNGDNFLTDGTASVLMENVSAFQFMSIGSIMKVQVCVKSDLITTEEYSICKEKTIF